MTKRAKWILIAVVVFAVGLPIGVVSLAVGLAIYGHNQAFIAGNEEATTMNIKSISRAQVQYYTEHGNFGTFDQLVETRSLGQRFAGAMPTVYGYVYDLKVTPASAGRKSTFTLNADPKSPDSGNRHFFINNTSPTIHVNRNGPANANDPPHVR